MQAVQMLQDDVDDVDDDDDVFDLVEVDVLVLDGEVVERSGFLVVLGSFLAFVTLSWASVHIR